MEMNQHSSPTDAPRWLVEPVDLWKRKADQAVITCEAAGHPAPAIQWYRLKDQGNLIEY